MRVVICGLMPTPTSRRRFCFLFNVFSHSVPRSTEYKLCVCVCVYVCVCVCVCATLTVVPCITFSSHYHCRSLLLMDDFNLTYANQVVVLQLEDAASLSLSLSSGGVWKDVSVTVTSNYSSLFSSSTSGYNSTSLPLIIPTISVITIGSSYSDLLQDFIVYDSPLNNRTAHPLASFLSECYCRDSFNMTSDSCVDDANGDVSFR